MKKEEGERAKRKYIYAVLGIFWYIIGLSNLWSFSKNFDFEATKYVTIPLNFWLIFFQLFLCIGFYFIGHIYLRWFYDK